MTGAYLVAPSAEAPAAPVEEKVATEAPAEVPADVPNGVAYDYTGAMVATISAGGDGVNLRSEPDVNSAVVGTLSIPQTNRAKSAPPPLWDGHTASRIASLFEQYLAAGAPLRAG